MKSAFNALVLLSFILLSPLTAAFAASQLNLNIPEFEREMNLAYPQISLFDSKSLFDFAGNMNFQRQYDLSKNCYIYVALHSGGRYFLHNSLYRLGMRIINKGGDSRDADDGMKLLILAKEYGNPLALNFLLSKYSRTENIPPIDQALQAWFEQARASNQQRQFCLQRLQALAASVALASRWNLLPQNHFMAAGAPLIGPAAEIVAVGPAAEDDDQNSADASHASVASTSVTSEVDFYLRQLRKSK